MRPGLKSAIAVAVLALLIVAAPAAAQPAHPVYFPSGSFDGAGTEGALTDPQRLAVDGANGNVLVTDRGLPGVAVFSVAEASGSSAAYLTRFGVGTLSAPYGIAIDPVNGDVYVSDSGLGSILRYASDGAPTPTYTLDPTFVSPELGTGPGQVGNFEAALAVDPVTRDLLVADRGNGAVSRFSRAGAFAGAIAPVTSPYDVAVGPDRVVSVTEVSDEGSRTATLSRYEAGGTPVPSSFKVGSTPRSLTVSATSGMLLVGGESAPGSAPKIFTFLDGGPSGTAEPGAGDLLALGVDGGPERPLFALTRPDGFGNGTVGVTVFVPLPAPGVEIDPPANVGPSGADLSGTVDPGGHPTIASFEYSRDGGVTWTATEQIDVGSGSGETPVATRLEGLDANREYLVRLFAQNQDFARSSYSEPVPLTTPQDAPSAIASGVVDRSPTSVRLGGLVNPFGLATTYHFEYGLDTGYGLRAPLGEAAAGSGGERVSVTQDVVGLAPGTTYHYRVVATNAVGPRYSADRTFTTLPLPSGPARRFELVSAGKQGGLISRNSNVQATADGESIGFVFKGSPDSPEAESASVLTSILARRGGSSWTSRLIDPPVENATSGGFFLYAPLIQYSRDLSHAVVASARALAPGAVEGDTNVYMRDTQSGELSFIATVEGQELLREMTGGVGVGRYVLGGEDDLLPLIILLPRSAGGLPGPGFAIYRWTPAGGLEPLVPNNAGVATPNEAEAVSNDASTILFTDSEDGAPALWRDGTVIRPTVSQVPGAEPTPAAVSDALLSSDGRTVYFDVPSGQPLTEDTPPGTPSPFYRFDVESGDLTYLTSNGSRATTISADGRTVAIERSSVGTPLTLISGEEVVDVADLGGTGAQGVQLSPSGRYLSFRTRAVDLTDYDVSRCPPSDENNFEGNCVEVYVYDAVRDQLACASCRADGGPPIGDARNGPNFPNEIGGYLGRKVDDAGNVFFDSPDPLVGDDVNGVRDAYVYRDGHQYLVSTGTANEPVSYVEASADGRDVFFTTSARLVAGDRDDLPDVYDARLGGGFDESGPAGPPACAGELCLEGSAGPPAPPAIGSTAGERGGKGRAKLSVLRPRPASGNAATLRIVVGGPGKITVAGGSIRPASRAAKRAAVYRVRVALKPEAKRRLRQRGKLRVVARVGFRPRSGPPTEKRVTIVFARSEGGR